jgi:hypothetical protein
MCRAVGGSQISYWVFVQFQENVAPSSFFSFYLCLLQSCVFEASALTKQPGAVTGSRI